MQQKYYKENPNHVGEVFTPTPVIKRLECILKEYIPDYKNKRYHEPCAGCGNIVAMLDNLGVNYNSSDLYEENVTIVNNRNLKCFQSDYKDLNLDSDTIIITNPPYEEKTTRIFRKEIYSKFMNHFKNHVMILIVPFRNFVLGKVSSEIIKGIVTLEILPPHVFNVRLMGESCIIVYNKLHQSKQLCLHFPCTETPGVNNVYFRKLSLPNVNDWDPWDTSSINVNYNQLINSMMFPFLRNYRYFNNVLELINIDLPRVSSSIEFMRITHFSNEDTYSKNIIYAKKNPNVNEGYTEIIVSRLRWNREFIPKHNYSSVKDYRYYIKNDKLLNKPLDTPIIITPATNEAWNGFYKSIPMCVMEPGKVYSRTYLGIKPKHNFENILYFLQSKVFACLVSCFKSTQNFTKKQFEIIPDLSLNIELLKSIEKSELIQNWPEEQRYKYSTENLIKVEEIV